MCSISVHAVAEAKQPASFLKKLILVCANTSTENMVVIVYALLRKHFMKGYGLVQCYFPWAAQCYNRVLYCTAVSLIAQKVLWNITA